MGNSVVCSDVQEGGDLSKSTLKQLFTCHAAGYQRSCSFSPFGTYGVFGGADKKLRFVKTNWDMLRRPQERSVALEGLIEWCSYTQEGVLLVVEMLLNRRTVHAWAVVKSTKQVLSNELASLDGTTPEELEGPYAVSQSGLHFVAGAFVPGVGRCIRVFTINLYKQANTGLSFPLAYDLRGFEQPVSSVAFITGSMSLLTSAQGELKLWALSEFEDQHEPNGVVTAVMTIPPQGADGASAESNGQEGSGQTESLPTRGCTELISRSSDKEVMFQLSENEKFLAVWESPLRRTDGITPAEANQEENLEGSKLLNLSEFEADGTLSSLLSLGTEDPILCCGISCDGRWLAVGTGVKFGARTQRRGRVQVYDLTLGRVATQNGSVNLEGAVNSLEFTSALSCDKSSWGRCTCLAIASDGPKLATGECMIIGVDLEEEKRPVSIFDQACGQTGE